LIVAVVAVVAVREPASGGKSRKLCWPFEQSCSRAVVQTIIPLLEII